MMGFLARWARRLSWRETAQVFRTSWEAVYRSVEWFVEWGLAHRKLRGVESIGVDEIHWGHGLRADNFLTVIYQIDAHCRRLLWVGKRRSEVTLRRGLKTLGPEVVKELRFVCTDMWKPYLKVIAAQAGQALHVLDRFHITTHLNQAVDQVRRSESSRLRAAGKAKAERLKHLRWPLLRKGSRSRGKARQKLVNLPADFAEETLFLPTYTAIAWYHKNLPADLQGDLQKAIEESRKFAVGEYTDALMVGDALPATRRSEITQKLARLTGLSPDYIDRTKLRIEIMRFTKELLRNERRTIGRIDARFTGIDRDAAGEEPEFDPSIAAIMGPYSGMLNDYARNDLKFDSDLPYEVLTGRGRPWAYAPYENRHVNVAETLRGAMTQNPFLHVFVAKGYYDLATPLFAADYTFDHLASDPTLRGHLSGAYYEAGHMMYVHPPSLAKLKADIAQFLKSSVAPGPAQ